MNDAAASLRDDIRQVAAVTAAPPRIVADFLDGPLRALLVDFLSEQRVTRVLARERTACDYATRNLDLAAEIGRQLVVLIRHASNGDQAATDEATALAKRLTKSMAEASRVLQSEGR